MGHESDVVLLAIRKGGQRAQRASFHFMPEPKKLRRLAQRLAFLEVLGTALERGRHAARLVHTRRGWFGLVGAGTDGYSTWKIGRYVEREFLPRRAR